MAGPGKPGRRKTTLPSFGLPYPLDSRMGREHVENYLTDAAGILGKLYARAMQFGADEIQRQAEPLVEMYGRMMTPAEQTLNYARGRMDVMQMLPGSVADATLMRARQTLQGLQNRANPGLAPLPARSPVLRSPALCPPGATWSAWGYLAPGSTPQNPLYSHCECGCDAWFQPNDPRIVRLHTSPSLDECNAWIMASGLCGQPVISPVPGPPIPGPPLPPGQPPEQPPGQCCPGTSCDSPLYIVNCPAKGTEPPERPPTPPEPEPQPPAPSPPVNVSPPSARPYLQSYCDRLDKVEDMVIEIGNQVLGDKGIDTDALCSLILAVTGGSGYQATDIRDWLNDAMPKIDLAGTLAGWGNVLKTMTGEDAGRVQSLVAARHLLSCLSTYKVGWSRASSLGSGRGSSAGVSLAV